MIHQARRSVRHASRYMSVGAAPVSRELWFRWVTFGALSPVMRTHHGRSARDNWNWESDADSVAHLRRWARLHMQLGPYLRMLAAEASATGAPLFRPFAFDYPAWAPGWTLVDQYQLGDRIAVAPVVEAGATTRAVYLPAGRWYGLLDGAAVDSDGAAPIDVVAAEAEIAAFVPDCSVSSQAGSPFRFPKLSFGGVEYSISAQSAVGSVCMVTGGSGVFTADVNAAIGAVCGN